MGKVIGTVIMALIGVGLAAFAYKLVRDRFWPKAMTASTPSTPAAPLAPAVSSAPSAPPVLSAPLVPPTLFGKTLQWLKKHPKKATALASAAGQAAPADAAKTPPSAQPPAATPGTGATTS